MQGEGDKRGKQLSYEYIVSEKTEVEHTFKRDIFKKIHKENHPSKKVDTGFFQIMLRNW